MLLAVQSLHDHHYIHCDIKPGNFMVHIDKTSTLFVIDFGLAQLFHNPATCLHIPFTTNHSIVGTLSFASINGQQGNSQSHRDDLDARLLALDGNSTDNNHEAVLHKKISITAEELCEGLPAPFHKFITHLCSLRFEEKPDYHALKLRLISPLNSDLQGPAQSLKARAAEPLKPELGQALGTAFTGSRLSSGILQAQAEPFCQHDATGTTCPNLQVSDTAMAPNNSRRHGVTTITFTDQLECTLDILVDTYQAMEDLRDPDEYKMGRRMAHHMLYTTLQEHPCYKGYLWAPFNTLLNVPRLQLFNQTSTCPTGHSPTRLLEMQASTHRW
ncbi:kinase-like domain-containing protein [Russula brevipes]|nr:kinase-like domain-containing protein [Russula brevipes]